MNIILRCVAVSFNAYVSAKIGTESLGLFTLVMSVYGLAVTIATSGVNLSAVKLTAERLAPLLQSGASPAQYRKSMRGVVYKCVLYSLAFSVVAGLALYFGSDFIGVHLLGDIRTILSLRVLSFSLPAISVTAALSGYFTGVRKVYKNASSAVLEQAMKIVLTSGALALSIPVLTEKVEYSCLAVVGGAAIAEAFSLVVNAVMYVFDNKRPSGALLSDGTETVRRTKLREVGEIALPVAVGAYARQGLSTAEHLAIPWGMRKSGLGGADALSTYGILQGMVFPLILFPSAVLSSTAGLLIPELTEAQTLGNYRQIERIIKRVLSITVCFAVGCALAFFAFSEFLGVGVYGSAEAGKYIKFTAAMVPVMYLDMATDAMLKGLGEQVYSMRVNIIDSASSLILVLILVPKFGIGGYVASVYFCEGLNCVLSMLRLKKVTKITLELKGKLFFALLCAVISAFLTVIIPLMMDKKGLELPRLVLCILIYVFLCLCLSSRRKNITNNVEKGR